MKVFQLNKYFKRFSLSVYYLIFTIILIICISFFSLLIGFYDYQSYQKNQQLELEDISIKIRNRLVVLFDTIYHIQAFMGKQIAQNDVKNLEYISKLYKNFNEIKNNASPFYSWTSYAWVDSSLNLVSSVGVGKTKQKLSHRLYLRNSKKNPWKLSISEPLIGCLSGQLIISTATGITNSEGKYLGSVVVGISVTQLTDMLSSVINSTKIRFFIVDKTGKIIISSKDNVSFPERTFFNIQKPLNFLSSTSGILDQPIKSDNTNYTYYRNIPNYPYSIILGMDASIVKQELLSLLIPKILQFMGLGIICLILLLFFKKWFINPVKYLSSQAINIVEKRPKFHHTYIKATEFFNLSKALISVRRYLQNSKHMQSKLTKVNKILQNLSSELLNKKTLLEQANQKLEHAMKIAKESDEAKEEFMHQLNTDLRTPINIILDSIKSLATWINQLPNSSKNSIQLENLHLIYQAAIELKFFTRIILKFELVDVIEIIHESIKIHNKLANDKQINFNLFFDQPLSPVHADFFRLKQTIVSLLFSAISNTPIDGKIQITCINTILEDHSKYIKILIQDTGFGLSEKDFKRIKTRFSTPYSNGTIELDSEVIRQLIKLHHGQLEINSEIGKGTTVIILLPCEPSKTSNTNNNIYNFSTHLSSPHGSQHEL